MKTITSIQKYFALALALCLGLTAQAQTVFFTEDFETDGQGSRYTASTPFNDSSADHWNRTDGSDIGNATGAYSSYNNSFFWAAEDTDDNGGNGVDDQTLDITGIDIAGQTDLQFQALFGGQSRGAGSSNYDSTDYIKVQAQIDGGGYIDVIWFSYLDGGDSSNEPLGVDTDFDGSADSASDLLGPALQSYSASILGTGSTLDIRIQVHMDSGDEEIAFDYIQLSGTSGGAVTPALLLSESGGSTNTSEGGATDSFDVTLSTLPSDDVTVTLTPGADVDLGSGAGVAIDLSFTAANGTSAQTVTVTAFDDADTEGPEVSAITISTSSLDAAYNSLSDQVDVNVSDNDFAASGDLIISQYYEGSSNNKYIEVTNIGDSSIDLTGYTIVTWSNAFTEEYKTATTLPVDNNVNSLDLTSLGTIEPGQTMVFANSSAASPIPASSADLSAGWPSPFSFNGDDSIVIYNSATPNPANIVDAIGFTDSGNEGANTSFVRAGPFQGYDLSAGSNASSSQFESIWTEVSNSTADAASFGDDAFIGTTALATAPTAINFANAAITVSEDGVSADLTVEISNPDGVNSVSVDVVFDSETSTADAADIDSYTTQTVTFPSTAITGDQLIVTVTITDDSDVEGNEEAIFDLSNVVTSNTNVQIGAADTATLTIQDNDVIIPDLIISEVADPNDNYNGRFVELYNPTDSTIDLAAGNWHLAKFVNANTSRSNVALTGTIAAGATYVIAGSGFSGAYDPLTVDQAWNDANGNGDDTYGLYYGGNNTSGTLVDILGIIGTDGTGEVWNYEDGRAVRNADVTSPSATVNASEWTFYSDESTSNQPETNGIANVADMTPSVHPDPLVDEPTGVSASAASDTEISVAFAAINSNDVIIVFDTDNTFTAPSGDAPSVGDSFAGGTVIYKGQVSPFSHTGLTASTQYYYSVFSVSGTDYSATTEVNATTQVAGLIYSEDFNNVTVEADDWFNATVLGTDTWDLSQSTALIDGYTDQVDNGAENHYLVSPALDFSAESAITISFDYEGAYDDSDSDSFELVYSLDYSGSGNPEATATWTEIAFDFSQNLQTAGSVALVNSGLISLPAALESESAVYLAFRYSAGGGETTSESWELDNILIQSTTVAADPVADYLTARSLTSSDLATDSNGNGFTVLEEYLAGFGDGSGPDAISYGINNGALTLTSDSELEPDGISVVLEATADLGVAFANVAFTASVVDNGDGTYTRSYTETTPPAGDQRFLRLSITSD
jgi:hypothetical protein